MMVEPVDDMTPHAEQEAADGMQSAQKARSLAFVLAITAIQLVWLTALAYIIWRFVA